MRATALCSAFAAIACGSNEAPETRTVESAPVSMQRPMGPPLDASGQPIRSIAEASGCASYRELKDVYGFCLVQWAGRGQGDRSVSEMCGGAGSWERECRVAWVTSRSVEDSVWETADLLNACPSDAGDCRFEVLDMRPDPDVGKQIQLCFENAGSFSGDCIAHSLERWVRVVPSAEEVERVAQINVAPDRIGQYIAAIKVCYGTIDACVGAPEVKAECASRIGELERKEDICQRLLQSPGTPQVPMGP